MRQCGVTWSALAAIAGARLEKGLGGGPGSHSPASDALRAATDENHRRNQRPPLAAPESMHVRASRMDPAF